MGILKKIDDLLQGKKTYVVGILTGVAVALVEIGIVIPEWVWPVLGALGLGAIRSAVAKLENK